MFVSVGCAEVVVFPRIAGTMVEHCRKYCGKAARVAIILGFVLGPAKIAPVVLQCPGGSNGAGRPRTPCRSASVHTRRSGGHVEVPDL